jgi:hypothetical protein
VRALGADVVICSDVSEPLQDARELRSIVGVLNQAVSFRGNASTLEERKQCDIYIRPDAAGLGLFSFDQTAAWIARGDLATQTVSAKLRALVAATGGPATPPAGIPPAQRGNPVQLRGIDVAAATPEARAFVREMLDLPASLIVDPDRMQTATMPAFNSGLFETVTYALVPTDRGTVAVITASGDNADRVDFGFRYDDRYNAALLFEATMRHLFGFASTGRLSLRLGEQTRIGLDVTRGRPLNSIWVLGTGVFILSTPLDFFEERRRVAEATLRVTSAHVTVGAALGGGGLGVQVKAENVYGASTIGAIDSTQRRTFASAAGLLWWSRMDRPDFARRGTSLHARYERAVGGGAAFSRQTVRASVAIPVAPRLSLLGHAAFGASSPDRAPVNYRFFLGSLTPSVVLAEAQVPFAGLGVQERNGFAVAHLGSGVQWEFLPNVFASFRTDVGNVAATIGDAIDSRIVGAGVAVGSLTLVGPVELRVHGRSIRTGLVEFSVGHAF